jgi:glyoxylase-like metal-dependent hydrolase (beta-lactamase superfamily II)
MIKIDENLFIIEDIGSANVFCVGSPKEYILIDSGIFMKTKYLIEALSRSHYKLENLKLIILTHCHCDHIGGVKELLANSDAKVAAHKKDIPYILQESIIDGPYKEMMVEEQRAMKQLNCVVPRIDIALGNDDNIELFEIINVPGHTPGSIALYQKEKRWMFFGDVIRENKKDGLNIGKPEEFNLNTEQVKKDAQKLLSYDINYGLLSHGRAYMGEGVNILKKLANYAQHTAAPDLMTF